MQVDRNVVLVYNDDKFNFFSSASEESSEEEDAIEITKKCAVEFFE